MKYRITCPHCHSAGKVPVELAGKSIRCKACQRSFQVVLPVEPVEDDGEIEDDRPVRRSTHSQLRFWIIYLILGVLVIPFDWFWWIGLESVWWKPMDDELELTSVSLGIRIFGVLISWFCMIVLGVIGLVRFIAGRVLSGARHETPR